MEKFGACLKTAAEQVERLQKEEAEKEPGGDLAQEVSGDGEIKVDGSLAVDPYNATVDIRVDDAPTVDTFHLSIPLKFDTVRVDDALKIENVEMDGAVHVDTVQVDDDNAIQIDTGQVDSSIAPEHGIAVDSTAMEKIAVDPNDVDVQVDPMGLVGDGIAVDTSNDPSAFQIDLTAYRRSRRI